MDYMIESTIGEIIPKPEVVAEFIDNGYYVVSDVLMHRLLADEREIIKLKKMLKENNLIGGKNNGKTF